VYRLETDRARKLEYFRRVQPYPPLVFELEFALKPASSTADSGSSVATSGGIALEAPDLPSEQLGRRRETRLVEE